VCLCVIVTTFAWAQIDLKYQEPPKEILKLADVKPTPSVSVQSSGDWMLLMKRSAFKTIEEVSSPEYRLAGLRINPRVHGPSRVRFMNEITLMKMGSLEEIQVKGLPDKPLIANISWSPDESMVGFTIQKRDGIELWYLEVASATASRLTKAEVNDVLGGNPYQWLKDNSGMIVRFKDPNRSPLIPADQTPEGPVVMENLGEKAPARTYQDLLKDRIDEENFDHFVMSKLVKVDLEGRINELTPVGVYRSMDISPDGNYFMTVEMKKPYSYLVPYYRFPQTTSIRDMSGEVVKILLEAPLEEVRPKGFMATSSWKRSFSWVPTQPASIAWVKALDGGDPAVEVPFRDEVFVLDAPFNGTERSLVKTVQRYNGSVWGDDLGVVYDYWWNTRMINAYQIDPDGTNSNPKVLFSYSREKLYDLPGSFVTEKNKYGESVLLTGNKGKKLYLQGEGYSPMGNRPFIDEYDLASGKTKRLYQASGEDTYERIRNVRDISKGELITTIESPGENPNYYLRNIYKRIAPQQLTNFENPYASIQGVSKQMISYKRDDGVDLNAVLYLPEGYDKEKDGPLPMLMWAYPREYKDLKAAGMVKDSPHRFTYVSYGSPIFWVSRGYAVLDRTDFPIVGVGDEQPNDTFVQQLVANAAAAIDEVAEMGVVDPQRVGVGGHSYGAFMTANLLAHSDLFAAGIARSGAYNRTLTPFGFQAEERTFWEAPEIYFQMSPFMHANKVNEPLLMIHGTKDNNSGTFPMQSERMYNAIKGHGGTSRLVMLPNESHGYAARESVMHMLWEMDTWLETYVKNKDKLEAGKQKIETR